MTIPQCLNVGYVVHEHGGNGVTNAHMRLRKKVYRWAQYQRIKISYMKMSLVIGFSMKSAPNIVQSQLSISIA